MDTAAQWPQDIVRCPKPSSVDQRKAGSRPHKEQVFNCPRCNSTNTKFCYYNNYSLSQPRYFCKTCRRYWTEGGSLRNIPVGGGSRKNKRSSSSSSAAAASLSSPNSSSSTRNNITTPSKKLPDLVIPQQHQQNPNHNKIHLLENNQDLNLGFSIHSHHNDLKAINEMIRVPNFDKELMQNPSSSSSLELLNNNGFATTTSSSSSRGLMSSFMSIFPPVVTTTNASSNNNDPISTVYSSSSGFSSLMMPEFKSSDLNFSTDGLGSNYGSFQGVQEQINGKLLFPFEDLKNQDSSNENDARREENRSDHLHHHQHGDHANGNYWNGVIGGGSW